MIITEFAELVYLNIAKNKPEALAGIDRVSIGAIADDALSEFARRMIEDPARGQLVKSYNVTLDVSGTIADLSPHTDMLVDSIKPVNNVSHISIPKKLIILDEPPQLDSVLTTSKYGYAVIVNNSISIKYPAGAINAGQPLAVSAVYKPTLLTIKPTLIKRLIDVGVELAIARAQQTV